jgi:hypothetical protein
VVKVLHCLLSGSPRAAIVASVWTSVDAVSFLDIGTMYGDNSNVQLDVVRKSDNPVV